LRIGGDGIGRDLAMQVVFELVIVLGIIMLAIVAVMAAVLYGSRAMGWGLHRYPKTALAVVLFLALAAALSYSRLFPGCTLSIGLGRQARCPGHQP
jgi:hypothetical protein